MNAAKTPETDALWRARRPDSPETAAAELDALARKLEQQRDALAAALEAYVNGDVCAHECVTGQHKPAHVERYNKARAALKSVRGE